MISTKKAITKVVRDEWGRVLASLIASLRDFELAEDVLQEALVSALDHWPRSGVPDSPRAWLLTTARRKAIDRIRRRNTSTTCQDELVMRVEGEHQDQEAAVIAAMDEPLKDERLRLIFCCCHPALSEDARVALTLKTIAGITTAEIARAFLVTEETLAQRIVRAKRKIKEAGIAYEIPEPDAWDERLSSVLSVIYLIFNEGYSASAGTDLTRVDLSSEAIRLCAILHELKPNETEVAGLLALLLLHDSRRHARVNDVGDLQTLEYQDRTKWNRDYIKRGTRLLVSALTRGQVGSFQIQAAISAVHAEADDFDQTDWQEIALLYQKLYEFLPTPVVMLNGAVALSYSSSPQAGLVAIEQIEQDGQLDDYQPFHAARAAMLKRAGMKSQAEVAYLRAIELSKNEPEKRFLKEALTGL